VRVLLGFLPGEVKFPFGVILDWLLFLPLEEGGGHSPESLGILARVRVLEA